MPGGRTNPLPPPPLPPPAPPAPAPTGSLPQPEPPLNRRPRYHASPALLRPPRWEQQGLLPVYPKDPESGNALLTELYMICWGGRPCDGANSDSHGGSGLDPTMAPQLPPPPSSSHTPGGGRKGCRNIFIWVARWGQGIPWGWHRRKTMRSCSHYWLTLPWQPGGVECSPWIRRVCVWPFFP